MNEVREMIQTFEQSMKEDEEARIVYMMTSLKGQAEDALLSAYLMMSDEERHAFLHGTFGEDENRECLNCGMSSDSNEYSTHHCD
jgi:hypothetical protein